MGMQVNAGQTASTKSPSLVPANDTNIRNLAQKYPKYFSLFMERGGSIMISSKTSNCSVGRWDSHYPASIRNGNELVIKYPSNGTTAVINFQTGKYKQVDEFGKTGNTWDAKFSPSGKCDPGPTVSR